MNVRALVLMYCVGTILLAATPLVANAVANVGAGADQMCMTYCAQQAVKAAKDHNVAENCPDTGTTIQTCQSLTVTGVCKLDGCKATAAGGLSGGNAMSTLSQLSGILGQVLGKLLQSSSGSGSASTPTTAASTGCTTSYYYTSNSSLIGVDPCALYQPGATSCTDPTATNYGASAACTYGSGTTGSSSAQDLLNALTGTSGTSGTSGALSASPQSGSAPLSVSFTTGFITSETYSIDFGAGSAQVTPAAADCNGSTCEYQASYTYTTAGTYTATLYDQTDTSVGTVTISVTNPSSNTGISQVLGTVGNFLAGTSSSQESGQTFSSFPGVFGNILLDQSGSTIFASTISGNSETSGFFGADTLGGQPQSAVGSLCENRPWASNFLANVIPPSFFDGLCQWGGYQVGQPAPQQQTQVTLTQTQPAPRPAPAATTTAATSTVPAQAQIYAVPSAVPLGARTSIFWNSQNTVSCIESSPDGNFSQNSLSGAASTVPLTGATTFTIACLDESGNPVTDYVTVQISS